jgi:hypothetical protein
MNYFFQQKKIRHEHYKTQYRAMFVFNCNIKQTEQLKFPKEETKSSKKCKNKSEDMTGSSSTVEYELFRPVECSSCKAEVGVYDEKEEIYHFFNILASHS